MYIAVASTKTNLTLQFCLASNMSAATKIQKQLCSVIYIAGTSAKNNATLHHIAIQSIHEVTTTTTIAFAIQSIHFQPVLCLLGWGTVV